MSRTSRLVSSLLAALTLTAAAAPAFAEGKAEARKERREERKKQFPMTAKKFEEKLEAGISRHLSNLTKRLDKHSVDATKKKEILAQAEKGAKAVRAAVAEAAKDGTVTHEEAKMVRAVVKTQREKVRDLLPADMKKAGVKKGHGRTKA